MMMFFAERGLWAGLQQLQASLFKLPTGSNNLWTRFLSKKQDISDDFCFQSVNYCLFGTRTIWHCKQFGNGQFVSVNNLTPGQFGNPANKQTIWHQEDLAPDIFSEENYLNFFLRQIRLWVLWQQRYDREVQDWLQWLMHLIAMHNANHWKAL